MVYVATAEDHTLEIVGGVRWHDLPEPDGNPFGGIFAMMLNTEPDLKPSIYTDAWGGPISVSLELCESPPPEDVTATLIRWWRRVCSRRPVCSAFGGRGTRST